MKKVITLLLALFITASMLAGCGVKEEAVPNGPEDTGKLVLYASWSEDRINPLVQGFTELTGIEVSIVTGGTSELINRIIAEKENPLGDILWGGSSSSYIPIEEYLMTYETTEIDSLQSICIDPEHTWYGFSIEPLVVIYNTKLVTGDDIPTGWKDLADPKWQGKMAVVDPIKSSSSYATFIAILEAFGKDNNQGRAFVKQIIENTEGNILSSSSLSYKAVADGKFMISHTGEESALKYINAGSDLAMIFPEEGTDAIVSPIAGIKGCPNEKSAQLFIDYMLSVEVQRQLAAWSIRSARNDIAVSEDFTPMNEIKLLDMDSEWILANGDAFKDWWTDTVTE